MGVRLGTMSEATAHETSEHSMEEEDHCHCCEHDEGASVEPALYEGDVLGHQPVPTSPAHDQHIPLSKKMDKKMANKLKRQAAKQAYKQQQKQVMDVKGQKMLPPRIQPHIFAKDKPMRSRVLWYPDSRPYSRRELLADRVIHAFALAVLGVGTLQLGFASHASADNLLKQVSQWAAAAALHVLFISSFAYHYQIWEWASAPKLQLLHPLGITCAVLGLATPFLANCGCFSSLAGMWAVGVTNISLITYKLQLRKVSASKNVDFFHAISWMIMAVICLFWAPRWLQHLSILSKIALCVAGALPMFGVKFRGTSDMEFHMFIWNCTVVGSVLAVFFIGVVNKVPVVALNQ